MIDSIFRALHIKFNIGMFMLPSEMIRGKHKKVRMVIGKPISPEQLREMGKASDAAQQIRQLIYNL